MYNEFRFVIGPVRFTVTAVDAKAAVEKARETWNSEYNSICVDMGEDHPLYDLEIVVEEEEITIENILLRDRLKPEHVIELSNTYYLDHPEEWEQKAREYISSYEEE